MRLSDLQSKDVISIIDGRKIGNIIDIKIEEESGRIEALVVEPNRFILNVLTSRQEFDIYWAEIEKIGEDVILVKMKV
ncbi:MAG: YlmC/YmxH family sporulation protein [Bacilli bacterium]|nr:YlmC/YmxH family sporulation protein [Bacilli bacterium]MDD3305321.1 YlmC/YmxH family sporulation protein [Bacilli bacterium]MDD4053558.1 YlmC/YmxH family sporulation protein [Bacilli bacterium]MDD4411475.1 YlmC/YmxH family sporulation protein [Bacilli bacterium]